MQYICGKGFDAKTELENLAPGSSEPLLYAIVSCKAFVDDIIGGDFSVIWKQCDQNGENTWTLREGRIRIALHVAEDNGTVTVVLLCSEIVYGARRAGIDPTFLQKAQLRYETGQTQQWPKI